MTNFDKVVFCAPSCVVEIIVSFIWEQRITASELASDLQFYESWRRTVPPIFLECAVPDVYHCYEIANPMRNGHPFWPRKFLDLTPTHIWAKTMYILGSWICKEKIRDVNTYKRCCLRWINDCCQNVELWYYYDLQQKLLNKITLDHFQYRAHRGFLSEALRQISSYRLSFVSAK